MLVFERLGHASATITLTVYQHVHPGRGREAADHFRGSARGKFGARSITQV
jgi:integrase